MLLIKETKKIKGIGGLSLYETLVSIAIISLMIGVLVQIFLLYNRIQREVGTLTNDTLTAKEIGIKIEKSMALSRYIYIRNSRNLDEISTEIETYNSKFIFKKKLSNKTTEFIEKSIDPSKPPKIKKISNYIYMVANTYYNIPRLFEVKIYVYNKYSKGRYQGPNNIVKKLAYYISIAKYY
ncbi:MAG: hypothetical protein ACP5RD_03595 [bacterium]